MNANGLHTAMGEELEVTILFADMRGFTKMSDSHLPYDVVFILNPVL